MSDWEIIDNAKNNLPVSDWEIVMPDEPKQKENLGYSLAAAIPRIGEDILKGGYNFLAKKLPEYYEASKTQIPGAFETIQQHPRHALKQAGAGFAELGQNVFNFPHDVVNYASNRLNLIPENINQKVQMARMPESHEEINQVFGAPQYPGEELIRGIPRNALNILGAGGITNQLNPMRLTTGGISKNVIRELRRQQSSHNRLYNNLWRDAQRQGINQVNFDPHLVNTNLRFIEQYQTPRQYESLNHFIQHPTLANAQRAQSDLGIMRRRLEDKERTQPLTGEERNLYDALFHTEQHIKGNMFRNTNGQINQRLQNRYNRITNSYRENLVPYRYNSDIQAFLNREITSQQLYDRLKQGEFAVKKGSRHPAIGIRNKLLPIALGAGGGLASIYYGNKLYNELMGNKE